MRHSVFGFQQAKLIENGLSVEDAFILQVIKDMYSSSTMEFKDFDGIKYMWINYTYLLEQIPIVGSKRNLMRKIEWYGKEYLLLRTLKKSRNGKKGNFSYVSPTAKLDELQDYDLMTESHKGYDKSVIRVMTESHNKDTSIKDTPIYIDDFFKTVWSLYPNKKGIGDVSKLQKSKLYKLGLDEITKCINDYIKYVTAQRKTGFDLKYQNGSTFFNNGYKDYLSTNQVDKPIRKQVILTEPTEYL